MKIKILIFILTLCLISCIRYEDPLRYKGCVVIKKYQETNVVNIQLKLSHSFRDSLKSDYLSIRVPKWEYDQLNIGDTIK